MKKKCLVSIATAAAMAVSLTACGGGGGSETTAAAGGEEPAADPGVSEIERKPAGAGGEKIPSLRG